jgi:SulP family sulfate permease
VSILTKPDHGIIVGVLLALVFYVWNTMHTRIYLVNKDKESGYFLTHARMKESSCPQIVFIKPEGPFIYVNAEQMRDEIINLMDGHPKARTLILDMAAVYTIDASGAEALLDLYEEMEMRDVAIDMIHVENSVLKAMKVVSLSKKVTVDMTKKEALSKALGRLEKGICKECDKDIFEECKEAI